MPRTGDAEDARLPSRGVSKHQLTELATGERVISERARGVRSVALGFWIGAGSRDEPDAKAGVSHFIEHLLFKGTRATTRRRSPRSSTSSAAS